MLIGVSPGHNYAVPSQSWMYQKKVPSPNVLKPALHPVSAAEDFITGEQSLGKYIQEYEEHEKKACVSMSTEETPNSLSFWNTSNSRSINEVSPLLRRCTYQLSTLAPGMLQNKKLQFNFLFLYQDKIMNLYFSASTKQSGYVCRRKWISICNSTESRIVEAF